MKIFHIHTDYTDGSSSIEEYFNYASRNEITELIFTEHIRRNPSYDFGLFKNEVQKFQEKYNVSAICGCEAKILEGGTLDISKEDYDRAELIVGSFHGQNNNAFTDLLEALPKMDVWGHPNINFTEDELKEIFSKCIKEDVIVEINLKYGDIYHIGKKAELEMVRTIVGYDAHSVRDIQELDYNKFFKKN